VREPCSCTDRLTIGRVKNSPFLGLAETRAAHLRQLSHHMRSLEWETASLADVEREIPELELAMAVYRRLHSTPAAEASAEPATAAASAEPATAAVSATKASAKAPAAAKARSTARRPAARRPGARRSSAEADPPSFKEFALKHLDALTKEVGVDSPDATAKALALAKMQRAPNGTHWA
jgi:hypothetical protein